VEVLIGTLAAWIVVLVAGTHAARDRPWRYAPLGFLEPALTFAFFDLGVDRTGAADAAVLIASDGVFSVALAWLLLGERATRLIAGAVAAGFGGAVAVGVGSSGGEASISGDSLVLASSATAALYGVCARRISFNADADPLAGTAWQLLTATVAVAPFLVLAAALGETRLTTADLAHVAAAIATGLLGSAIPFLLFNVAIRDLEISTSVLILNLVPVLAVGLAVVLLGDHLSLLQAGGAAAVVASACAIGLQASRAQSIPPRTASGGVPLREVATDGARCGP
jgi:drug/metabolite transporter (DMT)-like permease